MGRLLHFPDARLSANISLAVIIGCAPPFAAIIKGRFGSPDVSYDSRGYVKQSKSEEIKMKSMGSASTDPQENKGGVSWNDAHESEEALPRDGGRITVTTTVNDDDRSASVPGGKPGMYRNRPAVRPSRAT
jgi:hypothetical protein